MSALAGSSWRWLCVGAATLALCLLPSLVGAMQTGGATADPRDLLRAVHASSDRPYQGYAESRSALGLPDLPALDQVATLASGTTRIRACGQVARIRCVASMPPSPPSRSHGR